MEVVAGGAYGTWEQVALQEMKGSVPGDIWDYGWTGVTDIETDPHNPGWVYASVFGSGKGLYRSMNQGGDWEKILSDSYLRGVVVSPANSGVIYAVSSKPTNAGGYSSSSHGVMKSMDGGETWAPVNEGLSWPFASTVEIDPVNPAMVLIASPGAGCVAREFVSAGPVRTGLQPRGTLAYGITSATLSLKTGEPSVCRYSLSPDTDFEDMPYEFSTTDGLSHTSDVTGLADDSLYMYYCRCRAGDGDTNTDDYNIVFQTGTDKTSSPLIKAQNDFGVRAMNLPSGAVKFSVTLDVPGRISASCL